MHELSVCLSLLKQVEEIAQQHHATRVKRIRLTLGPLAGVDPHLLQQAFPLASAASVANGAELVMDSASLRVQCTVCMAESEGTLSDLTCRICGDWRTRVLSGHEMLLASVELETE